MSEQQIQHEIQKCRGKLALACGVAIGELEEAIEYLTVIQKDAENATDAIKGLLTQAYQGEVTVNVHRVFDQLENIEDYQQPKEIEMEEVF